MPKNTFDEDSDLSDNSSLSKGPRPFFLFSGMLANGNLARSDHSRLVSWWHLDEVLRLKATCHVCSL
jgi:hypothetical protein